MVAMRDDVGDHPAAQQAIDAVHRSFSRPSKRAFNRALINSINYQDARSDGGIHLGKRPAYDVDLSRLCRVIERVTRALFFHEVGTRLPGDHECTVYALDGFADADVQAHRDLQTLLDQALRGKCRSFGEKVFSYWGQQIEGEEEAATLWAFLVFSRVAFIALTGPGAEPDEDPPDTAI